MKGLAFVVAKVHQNDTRHPHLITLLVRKQCYVVPAYSPDGHAVNARIRALVDLGYPPDKVFVEIDNAKHVRPLSTFKWHNAYWMIADGYWRSKSDFELLSPDGEMDEAGMRQIAGAMLGLAADRPELFSERETELISRILDGRRC